MIYDENNDIQEFANDTVIGYLCENIKRQDEYIKEHAIKGDKGDKGDKGENGTDGANAYYAVGKFQFTWKVEVGGHFGVDISKFNITPKEGDKFFIFVEDTASDWICWCEATTVTETTVNCNVLSMQDIKGVKGDTGEAGEDALVYKFYYNVTINPSGEISLPSRNFNRTPKIGEAFILICKDGGANRSWICSCNITNTLNNSFIASVQWSIETTGEKALNFRSVSLSNGSGADRLRILSTAVFAYLNFELTDVNDKTYTINYMPVFVYVSGNSREEYNAVIAMDKETKATAFLNIHYRIYSNHEIEFIDCNATFFGSPSFVSIKSVTGIRAIIA